MEQKTNLRALRHRYSIYLPELSAASGLSIQYLSQAELGKIPPTPRLEEKMGAAVAAVILQRSARLASLERSYAAWKGRLLQFEEEGDPDE